MPFVKGKSGNPKGRAKGTKAKKTLAKEEAREILRQQVMAEMGPMTEAQIKNAKGISYLVYRDKKGGKFAKVKESEAEAILGDDNVIVEVWEERPSVQAYTDLMNRALDKPKEQPMEVDLTVTGLDERIRAARQRAGNS